MEGTKDSSAWDDRTVVRDCPGASPFAACNALGARARVSPLMHQGSQPFGYPSSVSATKTLTPPLMDSSSPRVAKRWISLRAPLLTPVHVELASALPLKTVPLRFPEIVFHCGHAYPLLNPSPRNQNSV